MRWPARLPRGRAVSEPVIALDILPTALAAAGIAFESSTLDGVDLLPFLTGATAAAPHDVLHWRQGSRWAVRAGTLKLVKADEGRARLFDLAVDRGESHDLAADRRDDVERLRGLHEAWSGEMAAPLVWDGGERTRKARRQAAKSALN